MLNIQSADIEYAAETKLLDLVEAFCDTNKKHKQLEYIDQAIQIRYYLNAVALYKDYLEDDQNNTIYECLKNTAQLTNIPVSPSLPILTPPSVNVGATGAQGPQGVPGQDGGATDFLETNITSDTVLDTFPISSAYAARWDFIINGTAQRAGTIYATWTEDGLSINDSGEIGTPDVNGSTSGVATLYASIVGSDVRLNATVTSGTWTITGSRYFIPNGGAGVSVNTNNLTNGYFYIGDATNSAQPRLLSGDISCTNTGVVSITPNSIVNADINASAGIDTTKFAAMTASRAVVSNASGFIEPSSATATEVGYLSGVTSNIQTQLDSKLSGTSGAISTVTAVNLTPDRIVISNPAGKIAVGGASTTEASYLIGVTSAIQTQLNGKVNDTGDTMTGALVNTSTIEAQGGIRTASSGVYLKTKVVDIGDWNMDIDSIRSVPHGLDFTKIRSITGVIRRDDNLFYFPFGAATSLGVTEISASSISSTNIVLFRTTGGSFDAATFDSTSFNRGWITIIYEA